MFLLQIAVTVNQGGFFLLLAEASARGSEPDGALLNFLNLLTMLVPLSYVPVLEHCLTHCHIMQVLVLNGQRGPVEAMQERVEESVAKFSVLVECLQNPVGYILGDPIPSSWPLTNHARFARPPDESERGKDEQGSSCFGSGGKQEDQELTPSSSQACNSPHSSRR